MNSNNDIQDELKDLGSTLSREHVKPVFDLPESYFENFAASVLAKIKGKEAVNAHDELNALSSTLSAIPRNMPFSVPEAYFSTLTNDLTSLIKEDEVPEALNVPARITPYEVPAGYFENLPALILGKLSKPKTKMFSLGGKRIMYYATAAMVAGLMAISGIVYFNSNSGTSIDPAKQPKAWVAAKLQDISNNELEDFINSTSATANNNGVAKTTVAAQEVRKLLNDVPDHELDAFLKAMPTDDLSATN